MKLQYSMRSVHGKLARETKESPSIAGPIYEKYDRMSDLHHTAVIETGSMSRLQFKSCRSTTPPLIEFKKLMGWAETQIPKDFATKRRIPTSS